MFNPGKIEGYIFPVVEKMQLIKVEEADDNLTYLWGKANRLRHNCSYRYIRWYLGKRGEIDAPARINTGRPLLRPNGDGSFGPWLLNIPAYEVKYNSYADAYHRCKYYGFESPWLTKTAFWN